MTEKERIEALEAEVKDLRKSLIKVAEIMDKNFQIVLRRRSGVVRVETQSWLEKLVGF